MNDNWLAFVALMIAILVLLLVFQFVPAHAIDFGQYDKNDPVVQWYEGLMQPDVPSASCCGLADAYWCDEIRVRATKTFCAITDDRDDGPPRNRPHVAIGTEIEIPNNKLKWDKSNPTGHAIVFLARGGGYSAARYVYCFVQSSGT